VSALTMIRPPCSLPGAGFAVNSIRQWWQAVGRARYPNATRLLITADARRQQRLAGTAVETRIAEAANELASDIVVNHLPPGTSKWNKIEHRLFSFHQPKLACQPLVSYRVIPGSSPRTELISATHHQNRPHRAL